MAGHSQFKNIMHRKGAQDAKRAKIFTKLLREVSVAAKISPDPESNSRLRAAIYAARSANLPKDRVDNAISKAISSPDTENFEEVRYEGYGTAGVAIIVEALTDNRNRTASDVRSAFTKFGGNLGETGSVGFMFKHKGLIQYSLTIATPDAILESTIESGAIDCKVDNQYHEIYCEPEDLFKTRDFFESKYGQPESASLVWQPFTTQKLTIEEGEKLLKMLDALEDCDDVQNVTGNFELPDELLNQLDKK